MVDGSTKTKCHWSSDCLNRQEEARLLYLHLMRIYDYGQRKSLTLNINAPWGFGKTYFLEGLSKDLDAKKHKTVFFNAWENDYSEDALVSLIIEIGIQAFERDPEFLKKLKLAIGKIITTGSRIAESTGDPQAIIASHFASEISSSVLKGEKESHKLGDAAYLKHEQRKKAIFDFKTELNKAAEKLDHPQRPPIFVLIDELDRCRPTYAIEILESIKHLVGVRGIFFIIATDTEQLSHTVKAVYGQSFDSTKYLNRFFDEFYLLRKPTNLEFIEKNIEETNQVSLTESVLARKEDDKKYHAILLEKVFSSFNFSLRDIEQCLFKYHTITRDKPQGFQIHPILVSYMISLKHYNQAAYSRIIEHTKFSEISELHNDPKNNLENHITSIFTSGNNRRIGSDDVPTYKIAQRYIELITMSRDDFEKQQLNAQSTLINQSILEEITNLGTRRDSLLENYRSMIERVGLFNDMI